MKSSDDGKPETGQSGRTLGVRPGTGRGKDIEVIDGRVHPGTGGMSVSPSLAQLPVERVPRRLAHLREGAEGPDSNLIWSHGNGNFIGGAVAPHLRLRPDRPGHGLVEPEALTALPEFEAALYATRPDWNRDEK